MTSDDRDLLFSLRRQQQDLQAALDRLTSQLRAVEARVGSAIAPGVVLPPVPVDTPPLPPLPRTLPPVPPPPVPLPPGVLPPPPPVPATAPTLEHHAGQWLTRIGLTLVGLSLLFLVLWVDLRLHLQNRIGPVGRFGLVGLAGALVFSAGRRLDRRTRGVSHLAPVLVYAGLVTLWFAFFAASAVAAFAFIPYPLVAGVLQVGACLYILYQAEKRRSSLLGAVGMALAYVSTAYNGDASFSIFTDLLLASTAAAFLMRHGWTLLAAVSLLGGDLALVLRLLVDPDQGVVLDTSRLLPYWPHAVYLGVTWLIFTAAGILSPAPEYRGGRRLAFISLNNAVFVALLALTTYITGYDIAAQGWNVLDLGLVFLVVSRMAGYAAIDPVDLMGAYAAQGLALFTAGIIILCTGFTRALALLVETFLLGVAGAFAGDRILNVSTYVAGFFATVFCIWQIALYAHHPWLLGFGGALVMLINAWSSRAEVRHSKVARSSTVLSTTCYCVLALGLIFAALAAVLSPGALPAGLATCALGLTFAIYYFSIFELPVLAQLLLLAALVLVLFPVETGEDLPSSTLLWVAAVTLALTTWWGRQRITWRTRWRQPMLYLYALALLALAVELVRPMTDAQGWMVAASFLAAAFLAYGAVSRVWPIAIVGQFLLVLALYHFFLPPDRATYPWAWWAAAVPVLAAYVIGRGVQRWLENFPEMRDERRDWVRLLGYGCKLLALAGAIRWIFGIVAAPDRMAAFVFFGTFLLSYNTRRGDSFGVRCSFVPSLLGFLLALAPAQGSWISAVAGLLLLAQLPLVARDTPRLVTRAESWAHLFVAILAGWIMVAHGWTTPFRALDWALYALAVYTIGLAMGDRRVRTGGLILLGLAILHVLSVDLWTLSNGYRSLTVMALALIMLAVGISLTRPVSSRRENVDNHERPAQ